jgi:hypothetical protein
MSQQPAPLHSQLEPPAPQLAAADDDIDLAETEWWGDLLRGVFGPRQGGARIIIDAENAATGSGKTGLAVYLAQRLARVFGYELQPADLTLSGAHYLQRWQDHPGEDQPSVIVLDEIAGAGAGNARRGMSQQNVDLGKSWQLMRKKRVVSIVTVPHWQKIDKNLRQQADYKLWCRTDPIGYFHPYRITTMFDDGRAKTEGYDDVGRLAFPNLDAADDPFFEILDRKKDELLAAGTLDADELGDENDEQRDPEEAVKEREKEIAQNFVDMGYPQQDISDGVERSSWFVSTHTE